MSQLTIYDTKSQQKKVFVPIDPNKIGIYVCGITVYDDCHIGHARTFIAFDVIVRYLKYKFGADKVRFVRNITDIDDKIINRAKERGITTQELTARYIASMNEDIANLDLLRPDLEPKATEYIQHMQKLVHTLIDKGYAYVAGNGDVYYKVHAFKTYGSLAKRNLKDLTAGQRIEINEAKEDPLDFVLWKAAKPDEPHWFSPWGPGRPGWHLECSAMSMDLLGETFDLHGGGFDLIFPHHENECAQSEAATGKEFVKTWLHVGFLQINQDKMSKSLGNFVTIKEVLQDVAPEELRYFMISGHYRSPLEYSLEQVQQTKQPLERLYTALASVEDLTAIPAQNTKFEDEFIAAMDDDFNTPEALAVLFDLVKEINKTADAAQKAGLVALLKKLGGILGLLQRDAREALGNVDMQGLESTDDITANLQDVAKIRLDARTKKNWQLADEARDLLADFGMNIQDKGASQAFSRNEKMQLEAINDKEKVTKLKNFIAEHKPD